MRRHWDPKRVRRIIALSLAAGASLVLLLFPVYSTMSLSNGAPDHVTASTMFDVMGPSILVPLLVPVVLAGLPLLVRRTAHALPVATTIALGIFTVISSATIGWFYVPALAAAVAAVTAPPKPWGVGEQAHIAGQH
ncbi:hypothetical protein F8G81_05515 [Arthrobacter sp. CDRTa11]|uniref:hypothetical protein n=1 Tax=Arthrobacter sp. CDRTa11 TaxID=2651199 RepID=UPI002265F38A|nr:hypothetical protein [Arthrobacter sp. CDRTa11]UZX02136.1 hypothetical protein F8G81_05515 [Arthrobacter sp. CDRTa11]